jgi:hypothetical protein
MKIFPTFYLSRSVSRSLTPHTVSFSRTLTKKILFCAPLDLPSRSGALRQREGERETTILQLSLCIVLFSLTLSSLLCIFFFPVQRKRKAHSKHEYMGARVPLEVESIRN